MAVDKTMTPFDIEIETEVEDDLPDDEVVISENSTVTPTEDGGMVIEFEEVTADP
jgi:hypothetical protein